ncbi:MAG: hypothetical protein KJZ80_17005 [Hyphomicrobiaceae bacterium]|nr:hypothetical protein [Hyphomicrobiaceae bacterium]
MLMAAAAPAALAQQQGCKFLNESCEDGEQNAPVGQKAPDRSAAEHLERCLADYVRRNGPFVPEGRSTRTVKSKSDMTAMCNFSIERKNYYWDYPRILDEAANFKCCMNYYNDTKACRENIEGAKRSNVDLDFCDIASKTDDSPPAEWNVPAGCKAGPCLVTPGYCESVGYSKMDRATARHAARAIRTAMAKQSGASREQFRAILRVCFGAK